MGTNNYLGQVTAWLTMINTAAQPTSSNNIGEKPRQPTVVRTGRSFPTQLPEYAPCKWKGCAPLWPSTQCIEHSLTSAVKLSHLVLPILQCTLRQTSNEHFGKPLMNRCWHADQRQWLCTGETPHTFGVPLRIRGCGYSNWPSQNKRSPNTE